MERLDQLTHRLLDGSATPAEADELAALAAAEPALQARQAALLRLEAALRGLRPAPDVVAAAVDRLRRTGQDDLERSVMQTIGGMEPPAWLVQSAASAGHAAAHPRPSRRLLFSTAALVLLAVAIGIAAQAERLRKQARLPVLASVSAPLELVRPDGRSLPPAVGTRLDEGATLVVPDGEQARLAYQDGSLIDVFGPSRLVVSVGHSGGKRLQLLSGGIELSVQPQPVGQPLVVVTPEGEVEVLGTKFRLATGADRTRIEMEEGRVAFVHHDGRKTEVSEGAFIVATPGAAASAVQPLPPTLAAPLWSRRKTGSAVAMTHDGARLALADRRGGFVLLDARSGASLAQWQPPPGAPSGWATQCMFSADDRRLVAFDPSGQAWLWNIDDGTARALSLGGDVGHVRSLSGGRYLAHTQGKGHQRTIQLWDLLEPAAPRPLHLLRAKEDVWGAAIEPHGTWAAIGSRTGWLHAFDVVHAREQPPLHASGSAVQYLTIAAGAEHLAYYSQQEGIRVWSLPQLKPVATWLPEGPAVTCLAFSPDGRQLAAALADHTVRLWSLPDGRPALLIKLPGDRARQLAFSADGSLLATAGVDAAVWELPWPPRPSGDKP